MRKHIFVLFICTNILHIVTSDHLNDRRVSDEKSIILSLDDQNILLLHSK